MRTTLSSIPTGADRIRDSKSEIVERTAEIINEIRGARFVDLVKAFQETSDPVKQSLICAHSLSIYFVAPDQDLESIEHGVPLTRDLIEQYVTFVVVNEVDLQSEGIGRDPNRSTIHIPPETMIIVEKFNDKRARIKPLAGTACVVTLKELTKLQVKPKREMK